MSKSEELRGRRHLLHFSKLVKPLVNDNNTERIYQLRIPNSQLIANHNTIHRRIKKICST